MRIAENCRSCLRHLPYDERLQRLGQHRRRVSTPLQGTPRWETSRVVRMYFLDEGREMLQKAPSFYFREILDQLWSAVIHQNPNTVNWALISQFPISFYPTPHTVHVVLYLSQLCLTTFASFFPSQLCLIDIFKPHSSVIEFDINKAISLMLLFPLMLRKLHAHSRIS